MALDHVTDFGEELRADQVAVGIVDTLEVVEIDKDDAEFMSETRRAVNLGFERLVEMPRVVEAGAIVGDGQFLDALDSARVIDGDSGVIAKCIQKEQLVVTEGLHGAIDELDHA